MMNTRIPIGPFLFGAFAFFAGIKSQLARMDVEDTVTVSKPIGSKQTACHYNVLAG